MEMPKPGIAHERLAKLAGTWTGDEKMFPSPWDPAGGTAQATTHARVGLGGFAVISDYEQQRGGRVTFSGHGVWTIDTEDQSVELHWFDCMGMGSEVFRGDWTGAVLTVRSRNAMGHARLTYDVSREKSLGARMETSRDGKEWQPMFEGAYTRRD